MRPLLASLPKDCHTWTKQPLAGGLLLEFAPDERLMPGPLWSSMAGKCATSLGRSGDTVAKRQAFRQQCRATGSGAMAQALSFAGRRPQPFPEYNLQRKSGKSLTGRLPTIIDRKKSACNNAACRSHDRRQALD